MATMIKIGFSLGSLVAGVVALGMAYGYSKAYTAKDEGKKRSYMISFFTFFAVAIVAWCIAGMIPGF